MIDNCDPDADVSIFKGNYILHTAWYSYLLHTSEASITITVVVLVTSIAVMLIYHTV